MTVTHYADPDETGITFIDWGDEGATIATVPPLCRQGNNRDLMTWFWGEVTCPRCKALGVRMSP